MAISARVTADTCVVYQVGSTKTCDFFYGYSTPDGYQSLGGMIGKPMGFAMGKPTGQIPAGSKIIDTIPIRKWDHSSEKAKRDMTAKLESKGLSWAKEP